MNWKKEIIKKINEISGSQSVYNIFADWIKMLAISISNTLEINKKIYEKREEEYKSIANKYTKEELMSFSEMCGILTNAFEEGFEDVLGDIYMNLQVSNKNLGQFFTPYHVCKVMAEMTGCKELDSDCYIEINEPSCGAGANIIAFAEVMKKNGINYQESIKVTCQDLDWNAVYMSYVQMSMYGVPAIVVQGNTLLNPYNGGYDEHVLITPVMKLNDWIFRIKKKVEYKPENPFESGAIKLKTDEHGQMMLITEEGEKGGWEE